MNATRRHSTSRLVKGLLLLVLGIASGAPLSAQQLWREGGNVAGRACWGKDMAEARLDGKYTWGGFKTPSETARLWTAGASAKGERRFRDLVLTGDFSFTLASGKDMYGSMFTRPGYYPVDVVEFTPGAKVKQTYGVGGSLSWINASRWVPGVSVRFEGDNYAKRKDIRHTTYRQELELLPSVLYRGEGWAAGATFRFLKTSEFIQAEQIGSATSDSYYAFLDKGLRYGAYQVWDGSGIHLKEAGVDRLPVKETGYGIGLQASAGNFLYAQAEYRRSRGEVGEKGYTWFRFPGASVEATIAGAIPGSEGRHVIRADYRWQRKDNYESVLEKVTEGGVTTPVEYGSNRVYALREWSLTPSYRYEGKDGLQLAGNLRFIHRRELSSVLYPFEAHDEIAHLAATVRASVPLGAFVLRASLNGGALVVRKPGVLTKVDESLEVTEEPYRLSDWYRKEREVLGAPRIGASLALRYRLPLRGLYIEASADFQHALRIQFLEGKNRQSTQLSIGYQF